MNHIKLFKDFINEGKTYKVESITEAELPKDGSTIKVGNTRVKIEYVGKNKDHIGFNWKGDDGESNYEETKVSDHKDMNSLINRIKDEIRYQRIVVSKRKNESVNEGSLNEKGWLIEGQRHKPVNHIENIEVKDKKNSKAEEDVESYISGNIDKCPRCGEHSRDCECSSNDPWSTQNYHRVTKKPTE